MQLYPKRSSCRCFLPVIIDFLRYKDHFPAAKFGPVILMINPENYALWAGPLGEYIVSSTDNTIRTVAARTIGVIASPAKSQPRNTAITGFTKA